MRRWRRWYKKSLEELKKFKLYNFKNELIENTSTERIEQLFLQQYIKPTDSVLQLGANIGTSCILVDKLIDNKKMNVCLEPIKEVYDVLVKNKEYNDCGFIPVLGLLSSEKSVKMNKHAKDLNGSFVSKDGELDVTSYTLSELESMINSKFSVLFMDCEGCFIQVLNDFPEILKDLRMIIIEKDRLHELDYSECDEKLTDSGFKIIESWNRKANFKITSQIAYEVWEKK